MCSASGRPNARCALGLSASCRRALGGMQTMAAARQACQHGPHHVAARLLPGTCRTARGTTPSTCLRPGCFGIATQWYPRSPQGPPCRCTVHPEHQPLRARARARARRAWPRARVRARARRRALWWGTSREQAWHVSTRRVLGGGHATTFEGAGCGQGLGARPRPRQQPARPRPKHRANWPHSVVEQVAKGPRPGVEAISSVVRSA